MRQLLALVILAVTVYGIVDCAQSDDRTRRNIPLWVWVALMILLPGVGAIIWLVISRLTTPGPEVRRDRPLAPDDDPEFLRELERRNRTDDAVDRGVEDQPPEQSGNDTDQPWGERP